MDVSPIIPAGRQLIDSYGERSFRVSGTLFAGSILVFPDRTVSWPAVTMADVDADSLAPVTARGDVEVLLLGCGRRMMPVGAELRRSLRNAGIVVEPMDTGAACRTYNILLGDGRAVAAALLLAR